MRLVSPVYFKEIGQLAVSRRPTVAKALLLGALFVDFLLMLLTVGERSHVFGFGELGQMLFGSLSIIELIAVALFTPVVTAGVVCGEKEANTLGLLFLTRLKALHIVQDKGLSRITFMVCICVTTLPFMFAALLFGGVETAQIVSTIGNVAGLILLCGGISMLCSTMLKKFGAALAVSYTAIFVYLLPLSMAVTMLAGSSNSETALAFTNPFASTMMCQQAYMMSRRPLVAYSWMGNLGIGLLTYLFAVLIASGMLRRVAFEEGGRARRKRWAWLHAPLAAHPAVLLHRGKELLGNPVAWKESNLRDDSMKTVLYRLADCLLAFWAGILFLGYVSDLISGVQSDSLSGQDAYLGGHACGFAIFGLFVAILAANTFSREREQQTMDILLSTRLSGRSIVLGTFWGLWKSVLPFAVILVAVLLVGVWFTGTKYRIAAMLPLLEITVCLWLALALGMRIFSSGREQRTTGIPLSTRPSGMSIVLGTESLANQEKTHEQVNWSRGDLAPATGPGSGRLQGLPGIRVLETVRRLWKSVLLFAVFLVLLMLARMWFIDPTPKVGVLLPLLNMVVYFSFILVLGMRMSLTKSSVGKAVGWTLGTLLAIAILLPLLGAGAKMGDIHIPVLWQNVDLGSFLVALSPAYWVADAPNATGKFGSDFGGNFGYVCVTTLYAVVTVFMLIRMIRRFDSAVGRQS